MPGMCVEMLRERRSPLVSTRASNNTLKKHDYWVWVEGRDRKCAQCLKSAKMWTDEVVPVAPVPTEISWTDWLRDAEKQEVYWSRQPRCLWNTGSIYKGSSEGDAVCLPCRACRHNPCPVGGDFRGQNPVLMTFGSNCGDGKAKQCDVEVEVVEKRTQRNHHAWWVSCRIRRRRNVGARKRTKICLGKNVFYPILDHLDERLVQPEGERGIGFINHSHKAQFLSEPDLFKCLFVFICHRCCMKTLK